MAHITIVQGHPDPDGGHFGHALADAYAEGAKAGGHEVRRIEVSRLNFPLLRDAGDFYRDRPPAEIAAAQSAIAWADHLVILYPLWHGQFPAVFHAFLEQTFRPGFAVGLAEGQAPQKLLAGKSARIVVTMGMPPLIYRLWFGAHSLKALTRNILAMSGIGPVRTTLIGLVGAGEADIDVPRAPPARLSGWLKTMAALGRRAR